METIIVKGIETELVCGNHYLVKYNGSKRGVRRIFKFIEQGAMDMKRLVFTSKVPEDITMTMSIEHGRMCFTYKRHSGGYAMPSHEISIPHYDITYIKLL